MPTHSSAFSVTRIIKTGFLVSDPLAHPACDSRPVWWTVTIARILVTSGNCYSLGLSVGQFYIFCHLTLGLPSMICSAIMGVGLVFVAAVYVCLYTGFNHFVKALLSEVHGEDPREDLV